MVSGYRFYLFGEGRKLENSLWVSEPRQVFSKWRTLLIIPGDMSTGQVLKDRLSPATVTWSLLLRMWSLNSHGILPSSSPGVTSFGCKIATLRPSEALLLVPFYRTESGGSEVLCNLHSYPVGKPPGWVQNPGLCDCQWPAFVSLYKYPTSQNGSFSLNGNF